jgi:transcriptional regulator with XRE-family HTH domain
MKNHLGFTYSEIVGGVLIAFREQSKQSQSEIAKEIGIGQTAYSRIEQGLTQGLSPHVLAIIAHTWCIDPHKIYFIADKVVTKLLKLGFVFVYQKIDKNHMKITKSSLQKIIHECMVEQ